MDKICRNVFERCIAIQMSEFQAILMKNPRLQTTLKLRPGQLHSARGPQTLFQVYKAL
jgi:hypothetical protein